jgi:hypothetical protein
MPNDSNLRVPASSAPIWENWSGNLVHRPATDGGNYYFMPTNLAELRAVVAHAASEPGATVRVSRQRHSQPPLVISDNRGSVAAPAAKTYLVDLSCYRDLGPGQDLNIVLGPGPNQVTVNAGVREDELDAFLTKKNLMLRTVTAGGFFSIGGMTAVDVHGGTVDAPIFAETVSSFTFVRSDGSLMTIDTRSPTVGGWSPLQFARVSLGGLGIVTSLTIDILARPYATTLRGGTNRLGIANKDDFVKQFEPLLAKHDRMEIFFTAYATDYVWISAKNFIVLWWDVVADPTPKTPNLPPQPSPKTACSLARQSPPEYGAAAMGPVAEFVAENVAREAQYMESPGNSPAGALKDGIYNPAIIAATAFDVIDSQVATANVSHSELWLTDAAKVVFMSYYIPCPI